VSIKGGAAAAEVGGALTSRLSYHALERALERGITEDMINVALRKGVPYWDPRNGSVVYVLEGGFASGRDLAVATNFLTGQVTTVMRNFGAVRPRFMPMPPP
jgi:hypothetical protein